MKPQVVLTRRASTIASGMGSPALYDTAINTELSATIEPTDTSMLPRMMIMVIGKTRKALSRKFIGVLRKVSRVR
jgi:hypothetical protein